MAPEGMHGLAATDLKFWEQIKPKDAYDRASHRDQARVRGSLSKSFSCLTFYSQWL